MLAVIACLVGVLGILVIAEKLWRAKVLVGEYQRKFVHVSVTAFAAFWPWLVSWRQVQLMGLAMLVIVLANRYNQVLHFSADLRRHTVGGICLAISISICAALTEVKLFYAIAILHIALADGFAAVIGTRYGMRWKYHVFGQLKTVIGTMTFWLASVFILGVGLLFAYGEINPAHYGLILLILPPLLAGIENSTPLGLDNLTVPLASLAAMSILSL